MFKNQRFGLYSEYIIKTYQILLFVAKLLIRHTCRFATPLKIPQGKVTEQLFIASLFKDIKLKDFNQFCLQYDAMNDFTVWVKIGSIFKGGPNH